MIVLIGAAGRALNIVRVFPFRYMTYGNLGVVIGHEIVHGFDVNGKLSRRLSIHILLAETNMTDFIVPSDAKGRRYDRHGNMTQWWSESLMREFSQRADCFIQQYAAFTIDHIDKPVSHLNDTISFFFFSYLY